jgi:hypothetical protein
MLPTDLPEYATSAFSELSVEQQSCVFHIIEMTKDGKIAYAGIINPTNPRGVPYFKTLFKDTLYDVIETYTTLFVSKDKLWVSRTSLSVKAPSTAPSAAPSVVSDAASEAASEHSLSPIDEPCRYFNPKTQRGCLKGDRCRFIHAPKPIEPPKEGVDPVEAFKLAYNAIFQENEDSNSWTDSPIEYLDIDAIIRKMVEKNGPINFQTYGIENKAELIDLLKSVDSVRFVDDSNVMLIPAE